MFRIFLLPVLACTAGLLFADEKRPTDKQMKEKMIATHRGPQSPYALAEKQATAEKPDWTELTRHLKALQEMSGDNARHSPYLAGNYDTAVRKLEKAVKDQDAKQSAEGFAALQKSCVSCHKYGGAVPLPEAQLRKEREKK